MGPPGSPTEITEAACSRMEAVLAIQTMDKHLQVTVPIPQDCLLIHWDHGNLVSRSKMGVQ